ncbi:DUF2252 domain-containing protein [Cryptosporangium minutisporangium]|uniref:DUF2252 domain-containing protein n=1 Tax=Cryptosporangium minutisporangium TaxID=113569 RepID=A0ABP6SZ06_9ACTN
MRATVPSARHRDPAGRAEAGLSARERAPLASHADYAPALDRVDPVAILAAQATERVPELVPVRHARMLVSPFTFYRGAAAIMAADLAATPHSGFPVQLCGDAHLSNFGVFGSPERRMLFDVNDFDETHPGPWEWDIKRLAASLVVAARANGFRRKARAEIVRAAVARYRGAMAEFAAAGELEVWYAHADFDQLAPQLSAQLSTAQRRKQLGKAQAKARSRNSLQAYRKLTAIQNGRRRIVADPPLLVPVGDLLPGRDSEDLAAEIRGLLSRYRRSLAPERRRLFDAFEYVDMARKVVGVGSVGTRCWIVLLRGRDDNDPLLLQVKEAQRSVLAGHVPSGLALPHRLNEGQRVVNGQRLMQVASDIFLGWERAAGSDGQTRDFYVRQLRDWKGSAVVEEMDRAGLRTYGELCAWTLSRAHARTGDRIAIAAYLGDEPTFDEALVEFSERYADQSERDYAALQEAVRVGRLEAAGTASDEEA